MGSGNGALSIHCLSWADKRGQQLKLRILLASVVMVLASFAIPGFSQTPFSPSQLQPEQVLPGSLAQEGLGQTMAALGDLNGDGVVDFAVGSPYFSSSGLSTRGKVDVWGVDGTLLFSFLGNAAGDRYGSSVALLADVNGDQVSDILIGAYTGGYIEVRSGFDGSLIRQTSGVSVGSVPGGYFGWAVAEIGDLDLDNVNDYAVSAPIGGPSGFGMVAVFSGATGLQIPGGSILGSPTLFGLGHAIAKLGDVNSDGRPDFLVSIPNENPGKVLVVSGLNFSILQTLTGTTSPGLSYRFGNSVTGLGDLNNDGIADFGVTEPGSFSAGVYSGATGTLLHPFLPEPTQTGSAAAYGLVMAAAGDIDRDGVGDILVSQKKYLNAPLSNSGAIYVYSGRTFAILDLFVTEPNCRFEILHALTSLGDINADGYPDIAFGSPSATNGTLGGAGRLYIQRLVGAKTYGDNINRGLTLEFFPGPFGLNSMNWGYLKISGGTPFNYFIIGAATQPTLLSPHDPVLIDLFNNPAIPGIPYGVGSFDANGDYYVHLLPFYQVNWMFERQTMYIQVAEFLPSPLGYTTSKGLMFTPPWL